MLHHVSIPVKSGLLDECEAFYAALGFTRIAPPEAVAGRARWLERSRSQIHLLIDEDAMPLPGGSHLALIVEDYDAATAALRELGAEVEPRRRHWGAPRAYVRDPAGNLVEIMAWAP